MPIHSPIKILHLDRWTHPHASPLVSVVISVHTSYTSFGCFCLFVFFWELLNTHAYMSECMRGAEVNCGCLASRITYLPFFLRQSLSLNLELTVLLGELTVNLGDSLVSAPTPSTSITSICHYHFWLFTLVLAKELRSSNKPSSQIHSFVLSSYFYISALKSFHRCKEYFLSCIKVHMFWQKSFLCCWHCFYCWEQD